MSRRKCQPCDSGKIYCANQGRQGDVKARLHVSRWTVFDLPPLVCRNLRGLRLEELIHRILDYQLRRVFDCRDGLVSRRRPNCQTSLQS